MQNGAAVVNKKHQISTNGDPIDLSYCLTESRLWWNIYWRLKFSLNRTSNPNSISRAEMVS